MPIIRSPSNLRCSLWFPYECGGGSVLSRGRLRTLPPPHSYGNQRLQWQFDGLLMMGIVMPETCWAVSLRQSNKILRLIVASSWVFYLSDWRSTEPQTLKKDKLQVCVLKFTLLKSWCFLLWRCDPTRVMAYSSLRFLDHTQRRTTVGRTPLDEWSARRRDLYLTTHNTHNRQTSMSPVGFEPTISAGERPQT